MKQKKIGLIAISLLALLAISCKNDIIDTTPLKPGEMQATVSGPSGTGQFYATNAQVQTQGISTYYIVASMRKADNSDDSLVIHILIPKQAVAPYTVNVSTDPSKPVVDYCIITSSTSCTTYHSTLNVGNAVVNITNIADGSNIQGTFSGTLVDAAGSGNSVSISGGGFNATF